MRLFPRFAPSAVAGGDLAPDGGLTACGAGDTNANKDTARQLRVGVTVYDMSSFITQGQEGMQAVRQGQQHRTAVELGQR